MYEYLTEQQVLGPRGLLLSNFTIRAVGIQDQGARTQLFMLDIVIRFMPSCLIDK